MYLSVLPVAAGVEILFARFIGYTINTYAVSSKSNQLTLEEGLLRTNIILIQSPVLNSSPRPSNSHRCSAVLTMPE